jgi:hypothetical protein
MTAHYAKNGLSFYYPENWRLGEQDDEWPKEIVLESPGGAMWSLHVYCPPVDEAEIAAEALKAFRHEYPNLEVQQVQETIGDAQAVGHDLHFYYLDLLVVIQTRCFRLGDKTLLLMQQAEDRDFTSLKPVFDAMTTSLVHGDR